MAADTASASAQGFFCSTSGTTFTDKESLTEHYKSDYHRYNLKRKVAGLPPVTKEWFEARKAQLASVTTSPHQKVWYDPLTKRKFGSENTYLAHVSSKKYQDLVRKSGQPAPPPVITLRKKEDAAGAAAAAAAGSAPAGGAAPKPAAKGYTMTPVAGSAAAVQQTAAALSGMQLRGSSAPAGSDDITDEEIDSEGGWETASDEEVAADAEAASSSGRDEEEWEEWDLRRSFFDNHVSASMQDNLEYMWKHFGFYLPDAEYLTDPEGLLKYLGQKLQYGKVPLYTSGDDPNAKQFRSLHAVQRHMVDTNQCKLLYDGNEDEYAEFYDYSSQEDAAAAAGADGQIIVNDGGYSSSAALSAAGYELVVGGDSSSGSGTTKVLGSRDLARYYKQRPRPEDTRQSVVINTVLAKYRSLGIETKDAAGAPPEEKRAQRQQQRKERSRLNLAMRTNINNNLPKNVPY